MYQSPHIASFITEAGLIIAAFMLDYCGCKYVFHFFTLADEHFIKDIFSISLKIRDKSV